MEASMLSQDINVLALIKGEERYVFLYNADNRVEMLRTLGRYAADPQLSFNWYDAAVMSKKVRDLAYEDLVSQLQDSQAGHQKGAGQRFSFSPEEEDII
jgi:hypothetical protein